MATEIWPIEGVACGPPDLVVDSLADRVIKIQVIADALPAGADIALQATLESVEDNVEDIKQHNHNVERWWGALAGPTETNAIEANVTRPFTVTSGADTWGTAIPILGTADNPVLTNQTEFDAHRILIVDLDDQVDPWRIRFIWGAGTSGDAITAGQWSEAMVVAAISPGNRAGGAPIDIRMPQCAIGLKMWAQSWNNTTGEVLDFFWGAHGYPYPPP